MSEGNFRSSMMGFNKDDVLAYIDTLKNSHNDELQQQYDAILGLQKSYNDLQQAHADLETEAEQRVNEYKEQIIKAGEMIKRLEQEKQTLIEKIESDRSALSEMSVLRVKLQELQSDNNHLMDRVSDLDIQNINLKAALENAVKDAEQSEQSEQIKQDEELERQAAFLNEKNQWIAQQQERENRYREETDKRIRLLEEENEILRQKSMRAQERASEAENLLSGSVDERNRYTAFMEGVGRFIVELHATGNGFLDSALGRGDSCLRAVEDAVSTLKVSLGGIEDQLMQARSMLKEQETANGAKLDYMINSLKASAETKDDSGRENETGKSYE